jgi:uncharacterized protein YecE (DUF72 family)
MTAFIGTSGWDYTEWRGHFYPADLPKARFLEHYSRALTACELNATFYGRQTDRSVARWASVTPDGFMFCAKAHMRITYSKQMAPDAEARGFTKEFVASLSGLGKKLGVVLMQFPAFKERDDAALADFLAALPSGPRYAFEFRHESWADPDVLRALDESGACLVHASDAPDAPAQLPGGPFAYVRLRAPAYSDEHKDAWCHLLRAEAEERDVFVFARHKGIDPADRSAGVGLAAWLVDQLEGV